MIGKEVIKGEIDDVGKGLNLERKISFRLVRDNNLFSRLDEFLDIAIEFGPGQEARDRRLWSALRSGEPLR